MNFFRSKIGIFSIVVILLVAAAVLWHCLMQKVETEQPDGTFVWNELCAEVTG